jgi:hypothetical protein
VNNPHVGAVQPLLQPGSLGGLYFQDRQPTLQAPQQIGRNTWPRANLQQILAQLHSAQRPRQQLRRNTAPPSLRPTHLLMKPVHMILSKVTTAEHRGSEGVKKFKFLCGIVWF